MGSALTSSRGTARQRFLRFGDENSRELKMTPIQLREHTQSNPLDELTGFCVTIGSQPLEAMKSV